MDFRNKENSEQICTYALNKTIQWRRLVVNQWLYVNAKNIWLCVFQFAPIITMVFYASNIASRPYSVSRVLQETKATHEIANTSVLTRLTRQDGQNEILTYRLAIIEFFWTDLEELYVVPMLFQ
uniref:Uncharacterized protein n=1 Tax=Glossina austeni TaxID=7395 RepID=A0A1A9UDU2_GLOAU